MSPRAAWRLESLGFRDVYDYAAGKADWFARGHPIEGERAEVPRVGRLARSDVPTCRLDESLTSVAERVRVAGWDTCIAVNDEGVVLGRLFASELSSDSSTAVEDVMRSGPSTFRPNVVVEELTRFMDERDISTALVTTSEGRLVGLFRRSDAEETSRQ